MTTVKVKEISKVTNINIKIVDFHHCVADIKGYYEDIEGGLDDGD